MVSEGTFDSDPSFDCGLGDHSPSLTPLKPLLNLAEESLAVVADDPLGHDHFPAVTLSVYSQLAVYRQAVTQITPQGAQELLNSYC